MEKVTKLEYLMNRVKEEDLSEAHKKHLDVLLDKVNKLLEKFGEKREVNSGIRSKADQIRIYKDINAKRVRRGLKEISVPMGSAHMSCEAIDLEDKNDKLKDFCVKNIQLLKELGLYMEDPSVTDTWVHVQIRAPKSGNTIFKP